MTDQQNNITEDEARLYDRQIRLWGLEAQNKMRNSKVLLVGMRGLQAEVCKNIVLSGIGSAYLLDDQPVVIEDLSAQFFLTPEDVGKNRAEASAARVQDLNPRVKIIVDTESINAKPDQFFTQFDIVCLTDCSLQQMLRIDTICKTKNIPVFSGYLDGFYGFAFMNHNNHTYTQTVKEKDGSDSSVVKTVSAPSFEELFFKLVWNIPSLRRVSKHIFAKIVILQYLHGVEKGAGSVDDLIVFKDDYVKGRQVASEFVPNNILSELWQFTKKDLSPVAAIVGGVVAQEIIKLLSGKDEPISNSFVFDGTTCRGLVEKLFPPPSATQN